MIQFRIASKNQNMKQMKQMTPAQIAELSQLRIELASELPTGMHGYLEMFSGAEQPQYVAEAWLIQIERVTPGVTDRYWGIVNQW